MSQSTRGVDVLVVGGGPAGIASAARAAEGGANVLLVDEASAPGGQIWRSGIDGEQPRDAASWRQRLASSGASIRSAARVVDVERRAGTFAVTLDAGEPIDVGRLIIATGARERFLPFPGWTLPGVYGAGGLQALVKSGLAVAGKRVVLAGSGPLLLPVATTLRAKGAHVLIVAEQATHSNVMWLGASLWRYPKMLMQAVGYVPTMLASHYTMGAWIVRAEGDDQLRSVTLTNGRRPWRLECDIACIVFGLVANTELARLIGCEISNGCVAVDAQQRTTVAGVFCAGESTGIGGVELSLVEGEIAGAVSVDAVPSTQLVQRRTVLSGYARRLDDAFTLRHELLNLATPDTIVCRCEDVRLRDFDGDWSRREAKLATRAGMGACQGRICGIALECILGWDSDSVRPPLSPVPVAALTGSVRDTESRIHK